MTIPGTPTRTHGRAGRLAAVFAAVLTGLGTVVLPAAPASAAARVTFSPATADPEYATRMSLRGSGFQAIKGGFGGIYVLFGWVGPNWRPSQGGVSGEDYLYVQDSEEKDNHGYQRFVAFEGSSTASDANGGTVHADGTWAADLIIPGATFPAKGRDGEIKQIDCRQVQCGIITIGAHGVVNRQNETFTPVTFVTPRQRSRPQAVKTAAPPPSTAPPPGAAVPSSGLPPSAAAAPGGAAAGGLVITPGAVASSPAADPVQPQATSAKTAAPKGWWIVGLAVAVVLVGAGGVLLYRRGKRAGAGAGA
jgi:hypothetical protein